eukprot:m.358759 g.358759  ORF g.358759 m.358759 type:complete len:101 (+) comp18268_c0_seq1:51-353(+)
MCFVEPSGGKSDWCGRNTGVLSMCLPLSQLIICQRDPRYTEAEIPDAYDSDADKTMCWKCAVCAGVCLPFYCLVELSLSVFQCFRPSNYTKDQYCQDYCV